MGAPTPTERPVLNLGCDLVTGLSKQTKAKTLRRLRMTAAQELAAATGWVKPPPDECEREDYDAALPGADASSDALIIRMVRHRVTYQLVEFAIIQMTRHRGVWVEVAEADSCHDVDVHVHQNGKKAGGRSGTPTTLGRIDSLDEVEDAYVLGLSWMEESWQRQKDRWKHG